MVCKGLYFYNFSSNLPVSKYSVSYGMYSLKNIHLQNIKLFNNFPASSQISALENIHVHNFLDSF